ncbi:hypothetical protein LVB87_12960 [Lysobacter sp. KIS68-7]|uniref:hypothetical protein n=1 Tax=Lysobacter sp. KIS68-7 TaxID=2904252 RepID=UPI001E5B5879|nr:hypothetical protein [Lysobacter sp. KIS68-7]UHQ19084.1 hypothetical protein LVB87_12960 [Lysobacter sp. KIS68-7]
MDQDWFEMRAERRRPHSGQTWIPLRALLSRAQGDVGQLGYLEDFSGALSIAVPSNFRAAAEELEWGDSGLANSHGAYASPDGSYKTVDTFQFDDGVDAGVHLVLAQRNPIGDDVWHLNQDLVLALGLIEDGDAWVQPDENFAVVAKRVRRADASVAAILIRTDFLCDYLCARGLALRLLTYRDRVSIEASAGHITWPGGQQNDALADGRFTGRVDRIHPGGDREGATVAVFHSWRTDVDVEADVPIMGPETDDGTDHTHRRFTRAGPVLHRISGEVWRCEWIEPAARSPCVRGDHVPSSTSFIVNAAGDRRGADELNDEDIGLWLWFDAAIVRDLLALRAGRLEWYTHDTGGLEGEPGYTIHFGINEAGLINVYARDVARLSEWHRRFWAGRNLYPDGRLSAELAMSHIEARVADTTAPEQRIADLLTGIDAAARESWGFPIFRQHGIENQLLASLHRFRGVDRSSLLELAKDVARLTADRIDAESLQRFAPPTAQLKGTGSLKSLERALAVHEGAARARSMMGPLAGIYDLRVGAAHLPGSEIEAAFALAGIDPNASSYNQSLQLLTALAQSLESIEASIRASGRT